MKGASGHLGTEAMSDGALVRYRQEHHGEHSPMEEDVFAELYRRHRENLIGFLVHHFQSTVEEAEDIADDAFEKAHEKLMTIHDPDHFRSWLYRTAINIGLNHMRREHVHAPGTGGEIVVEPASGILTAPEDLVERETHQQIVDAMAQLSSLYREAIRLFYFEGLDYNEIAAAEHIPLGTVRSRLSGARQQLKGLLEYYVARLDDPDFRG